MNTQKRVVQHLPRLKYPITRQRLKYPTQSRLQLTILFTEFNSLEAAQASIFLLATKLSTTWGSAKVDTSPKSATLPPMAIFLKILLIIFPDLVLGNTDENCIETKTPNSSFCTFSHSFSFCVQARAELIETNNE